jgi:hypothetical protein
MTTYAWPTTAPFWPAAVRWRALVNESASTSSLSGYTQVRAVPGLRWAVSLDMPEQSYDHRRALGMTFVSGKESVVCREKKGGIAEALEVLAKAVGAPT